MELFDVAPKEAVSTDVTMLKVYILLTNIALLGDHLMSIMYLNHTLSLIKAQRLNLCYVVI